MRIYLALDWPDNAMRGAVAVVKHTHGHRHVLLDVGVDPWTVARALEQAWAEMLNAAGLEGYPVSERLF